MNPWYLNYVDANSEIGAHVRSKLCYLFCLRHLITPRAVTNRFFLLRKDQFSFMRAKFSFEFPYNISIPFLNQKIVII